MNIRSVEVGEELSGFLPQLTEEGVKGLLDAGGFMWVLDDKVLTGLQPLLIGGWEAWMVVTGKLSAGEMRDLIRKVRTFLKDVQLYRVQAYIEAGVPYEHRKLTKRFGFEEFPRLAFNYLGPGKHAYLYEWVPD